MKKTWVLCMASALLALTGCGGRMTGSSGNNYANDSGYANSSNYANGNGYANGDNYANGNGYANGDNYANGNGYANGDNYTGSSGTRYGNSYYGTNDGSLMEDAGNALRNGVNGVRRAAEDTGNAIRDAAENNKAGSTAR